MTRLRPERAGIVNLWDFTDHEFSFHGGRLVLRGANGAGKTKALELLFPFLLDARIDPKRLDPFSGAGRTMRDNLLYRPDRETVIGYAWMEFGDGDRTIVIGAGLRAQRARSDVTTWFFVSDRAMGNGWSLISPERQPLTMKELRTELGAANVFDVAGHYRARLARDLFGGVDDARYEAAIQLLLYLRRPQLAKDLDVRQLSATLSAGLRPIDDELLAEGARSFDDLEIVQRELERLEHAADAAVQFLAAYRPYVRVLGRHRTDVVVTGRSAAKRAAKATAAASLARDDAHAARATAAAALSAAQGEQARFEDERAALQRSEAYRSIGQLDDLKRHVTAANEALHRAQRDADQAAERAAKASERQAEANRSADAAAAASTTGFGRLRTSAATVTPASLAEIDGLATVDDPGPSTSALAHARRIDLRSVTDALSLFDRLAAEAARAERELASATELVDEAEAQLAEAQAAADTARAELTAQTEAWVERWPRVDPEVGAALHTEAAEAERPDLRDIVRTRSALRRQELSGVITRLTDEHVRVTADRDRLTIERSDIAGERDDAPAPPTTLRRDRADAVGAPLWQLVDFRPDVSDDMRAGVEVALHAAGLLDAWLSDHANDHGALDAYLLAAPVDPSAPTLARYLVADLPVECTVSAATVNGILASIRVDGLGASVSTDGSFALGPLVGRSARPTADYIGATARANRRARRIGDLDLAIDDCDHRMAELSNLCMHHETELADIERSIEDLPSSAALEQAVRGVDAAAAHVETRRADARRRDHDAAEASTRRTSAADTLRREAAHRDLPSDRVLLGQFEEALRGFERAAEDFARYRSTERSERSRAAELAMDAAERGAEADRLTGDVTERQAEQHRLSAQLATLEDIYGAAASEVVATLARVEVDLKRSINAVEAERQQRESAGGALIRAEAQIELAAAEAERAERDLAAALERIHVVRRPELRAALGLADTRDLDAYVDALDTACAGVVASDERRQATKTAVRTAFQRLETSLGPRYHASLDDDDDVDLAMVGDDDGRASIAGFTERITKRRNEQQLLLTAQERQVLEDTLIDTLCRELYHRLRDAEQLVKRMNHSLVGRSTTTGKTVQLSWTANDDLSEDQRQIVKLLDRDPAFIGEDRVRLRESLAQEIRTERANDPGAAYAQILGKVLDYRSWRSFVVKLRERDGTERVLSKRLFNQHSGGERATILHLPLFAAAAAHFGVAGDSAPRLIALDEAFAGIDTTTIRQLLALTVEFDLDIFLTGHDFWGTFPEVPALSVVQLSHDRDSHTVSSLNMTWDGATLTRLPS